MSTERSDQEQERPRRRSPMAVASVAAAVLIVGGGGAYLVTAAASGDAQEGGSQLARTRATPLPRWSWTATPGAWPPVSRTRAAASTRRRELPEGPGEAAVQRFDAPREADVAKLAKALGVSGEPRTEGGSWLVGTAKDGQGPLLRVNKQAPGTWSYQGHTPPHGDDCPKGKMGACFATAPGRTTRSARRRLRARRPPY
ncbi:hypothetical protein ACW23B_06855 [Streptomyces albidoflavus]